MYKTKKLFFYVIFFAIIVAILTFMHVLIGPIIVAFLLSFILDPILEYFEKQNIKRSYSAIFIIALLTLTFILTLWVLFPIIYNQILTLTKLLPDFKIYIENILIPKTQKIISDVTGQRYNKKIHFYDIIPMDVGSYIETIFFQIGASTKYVVSWLVVFVVTPILLFFFLKDLRKIYGFIKSLIPFQILPDFIDLARELDKKLKSVIMGQITVISILCVLYSSFLFIAGLPSAIAVGFLTGIARFVPYFDTLVGGFLCFFVLVTNSADNKLILEVIVAFLSVQSIDGLFITPKIMGKFSELPPFFVLLSVICFGSWFGFYGILLAVPAAATGKVVAINLIQNYKKSKYFYQR